MVSQKVVIKNPTGLHLRPAGILCKEAMQFKSLITFTFRGSTANAKSVLSVLGACVKCGDEIEFICTDDADKTVVVSVTNIYHFDNFAQLYKSLPLLKCGYTEDDVCFANPDDMNVYYPPDKQMKYGVIGIEIMLV